MALDPQALDALKREIVEAVIREIAEFGDEGGDYDDMADPGFGPGADMGADMGGMPEDIEGERMADVGMGFIPGMVGDDEYEDDEEAPVEDDEEYEDEEAPVDDEDDEYEDDDEPVEDDEEEEEDDTERYMAGDKMISGPDAARKIRNASHCNPKGDGMKKSKHNRDPEGAVVLERYQGDSELVRYQRALDAERAERSALAKEIGSLKKQIVRYQKENEQLAAHYYQTHAVLKRQERAQELANLKAEGYRLDIDEELARTERYSNDDFDGHLKVIRERYAQDPADDLDFIETAPSFRPSPNARGSQPIDYNDMARFGAQPSVQAELRGLDPGDKANAVMVKYQKSIEDGSWAPQTIRG